MIGPLAEQVDQALLEAASGRWSGVNRIREMIESDPGIRIRAPIEATGARYAGDEPGIAERVMKLVVLLALSIVLYTTYYADSRAVSLVESTPPLLADGASQFRRVVETLVKTRDVSQEHVEHLAMKQLPAPVPSEVVVPNKDWLAVPPEVASSVMRKLVSRKSFYNLLPAPDADKVVSSVQRLPEDGLRTKELLKLAGDSAAKKVWAEVANKIFVLGDPDYQRAAERSVQLEVLYHMFEFENATTWKQRYEARNRISDCLRHTNLTVDEVVRGELSFKVADLYFFTKRAWNWTRGSILREFGEASRDLHLSLNERNNQAVQSVRGNNYRYLTLTEAYAPHIAASALRNALGPIVQHELGMRWPDNHIKARLPRVFSGPALNWLTGVAMKWLAPTLTLKEESGLEAPLLEVLAAAAQISALFPVLRDEVSELNAKRGGGKYVMGGRAQILL